MDSARFVLTWAVDAPVRAGGPPGKPAGLKRHLGLPETGGVRALPRFRPAWVLALAFSALLALVGWAPTGPSRPSELPDSTTSAAAATPEGAAFEGAADELAVAQREQALIRAESTATLLRVLRTQVAQGEQP